MSVFEAAPHQPHPPTAAPRSRRLRRALAVVTAPATATAVWAIEVPLAGIRLGVHVGPPNTQVVGVGPVVAASVVASLVGWAILEIAEARARNPRRTWSTLAVGALAASLALPLTAAIGATAMIALIALHLAVGGVVIPQLRSSAATSNLRAGAAEGPPAPRHRWSTPSRTAALVLLAAVVAGGAFAAVAGATSRFGPHPGGPFGLPARFAPGGGSGPRGLASVGGDTGSGWGGGFGHRLARDTERFEVASTNPTGPGAIIVTGVVDAGGVEDPGRTADSAHFADGGFRIDHASGRPTERFDAATCVGTISEASTFAVIDGTGRFADLSGTGRYIFRATYTTARDSTGCNQQAITAYEENIDGVVELAPHVVRQLTAPHA
jgi:hypothetical protein